MSELELENKMKQILDDYAPILNVTPLDKIAQTAIRNHQSETNPKSYHPHI